MAGTDAMRIVTIAIANFAAKKKLFGRISEIVESQFVMVITSGPLQVDSYRAITRYRSKMSLAVDWRFTSARPHLIAEFTGSPHHS